MEESESTEVWTSSSTTLPETSDPTEDDLDIAHYAIVFSQVLVWVLCNFQSQFQLDYILVVVHLNRIISQKKGFNSESIP